MANDNSEPVLSVDESSPQFGLQPQAPSSLIVLKHDTTGTPS